MPTKFFKAMTQPIAGMTLFALMGASWSSVAVAQLPILAPDQFQPAPVNNRLQQPQPALSGTNSAQLQTVDSNRTRTVAIVGEGNRPGCYILIGTAMIRLALTRMSGFIGRTYPLMSPKARILAIIPSFAITI